MSVLCIRTTLGFVHSNTRMRYMDSLPEGTAGGGAGGTARRVSRCGPPPSPTAAARRPNARAFSGRHARHWQCTHVP